MIGQANNINLINSWIKNNSLSRFIIIDGQEGSGRKTLANYIAKRLNVVPTYCGIKIDEVRQVIETSYSVNTLEVYVFDNADKMSIAAMNSLLKVVEEPPNNAYFMMIIQNHNLLETLFSRGRLIEMEPYTTNELCQLFNDIELVKYCDTPKMVLDLKDTDYHELIDFCALVCENIATVTGVNAFKIANKLDLNEIGEGFNLRYFIHILTVMYIRDFIINSSLYSLSKMYKVVKCTQKLLNDINNKSYKNNIAVDYWILEMRDILNEESL